MSLEPILPSFADYSQALQRLRRRTAFRRAVMGLAGSGSFELSPGGPSFGGEDQERRDREVLDVWERHRGPSWVVD